MAWEVRVHAKTSTHTRRIQGGYIYPNPSQEAHSLFSFSLISSFSLTNPPFLLLLFRLIFQRGGRPIRCGATAAGNLKPPPFSFFFYLFLSSSRFVFYFLFFFYVFFLFSFLFRFPLKTTKKCIFLFFFVFFPFTKELKVQNHPILHYSRAYEVN